MIALQGDPLPKTTGGRVMMIGGFAVGLVLVASLAGVIGSFPLEGRHEPVRADEGPNEVSDGRKS